ncbi:MAG: efflux RND transporter periplasmic adaptor subunit [Paraglaciecola sp.]|nr:efflux RND transporter periplasmic adaptor subunit [Paraglaciecola sp.]
MRLIFITSGAALLGALSMWFALQTGDNHSEENNHSASNKPLYWVAPMDPNYRRDKPGLSPMGMELVPVYAEEKTNAGQDEGVVNIAANIVNNLGVRLGVASYRELSRTIHTVGYVQFNPEKLVHLHPRVEGWVDQLFVNSSGEAIRQGQALYTLYSPTLVNAQEEYLLAKNRKNQVLLQAAKELLVALQMPTGSISALESSNRVQQTITYYAPQTGVVDELNIREGFFVKPGTTLMSIANLDDVWVEAEIAQRQMLGIQQGAAATFAVEHLNTPPWQGSIEYIYPSMNAANRTVRLRLRIANPEHQLKPAMFGDITLPVTIKPRALVVPREAVIRSGKQDRVVLALNKGQYKSVAVSLGQSNDEYFEIIAGLEDGDQVVTSAQFLLDSESSINSDFKRYDQSMMSTSSQQQSHDKHAMHNMDAMDEQQPHAMHDSPQIVGHIESVDLELGILRIHHGPIAAWQRPAMTMNFKLAPGLSIPDLRAGDTVLFRFTASAEGFVISELSLSAVKTEDDHAAHSTETSA